MSQERPGRSPRSTRGRRGSRRSAVPAGCRSRHHLPADYVEIICARTIVFTIDAALVDIIAIIITQITFVGLALYITIEYPTASVPAFAAVGGVLSLVWAVPVRDLLGLRLSPAPTPGIRLLRIKVVRALNDQGMPSRARPSSLGRARAEQPSHSARVSSPMFLFDASPPAALPACSPAPSS